MAINNSPTPQTRTIKWLYILALSMVAMLTITGQVLVQWSLSALQGDSTTVNIAGRQRMLSQRIPRNILALDADRRLQATFEPSAEINPPANQKPETDLEDSLGVWRANHFGLATASTAVGLAEANSQTVDELFAKLEPDFAKVESIAMFVIERLPVAEKELLSVEERTALIQHSDAFLSSMDAIVAQYELEARQRVSRLQWIERGLLIATLLVLVCEGLFIFSPAIESLNRTFQRLSAVTEQLESAKESAEQANRAKTQFLARVSHELRTPLHAILGMLGLIRNGRLTHNQKQRADLAYYASRTLRHLVDDLLDVSSAESGSSLTLHLKKTNLAKLVSDCVKLLRQQAHRKSLNLRAVNELPSGACFLLDEYRVRQILFNLIQNAIRYTSTGEIECRTWLEDNPEAKLEADQVWLNISVRDTGCGIARANLDRIFENFVQLNPQDGPSVMGPRLGLGLPITASLVAAMRGTIAVESKLGEGSIFSIRLPTKVAEQNETTAQHESKSQSLSRNSLRYDSDKGVVTALVVDDSNVNRLLLRDYLKRLGIRACGTSSLERALQLYKERLPQLVLLDLHVGSQNSLGLVNSIRALPVARRALVYIITADCQFTKQNLPMEIDVAGVLYKPIEFDELSDQLGRALQSDSRQTSCTEADSPTEFGELRAELRRLLSEQLPAEIQRLNEATVRGNFKTIQLIAHRLRGSAANAAWTELADAAANLEALPASATAAAFAQACSVISRFNVLPVGD